jgi:hypothetical protein
VSDASGERVALDDADRAAATRGWRPLTSQSHVDATAMDGDFRPGPASMAGIAARRGVA